MIKSSLALSSIATEIVAQYTKIVRGKDSIAFGITKVLSGILAMAVNFWVGMILILIGVVISYVKDDELEDWLKHCALMEKYKDSSAYQDIKQQKTEFEKVLESMFGITKKILNRQLSDPVDESTNSDRIATNQRNLMNMMHCY